MRRMTSRVTKEKNLVRAKGSTPLMVARMV
jgi:hypothetical protein